MSEKTSKLSYEEIMQRASWLSEIFGEGNRPQGEDARPPTKRCYHCGTEVPAKTVFCPNCKRRFIDSYG